jgi:hypothetical protein
MIPMKKLTAKQNMTVANTLMCIGVAINLVDMIRNPNTLRPVPVIAAIVLVAIGAVWAYVFVKCPHCGDKLKGCRNKMPERCPVCNGRLDQLPEEP